MSFETEPVASDPGDRFYDLMESVTVVDGPQGPYQHIDGLLDIGGMLSAYRDDSFCRIIVTTPRFVNEFRWDPRFVNETSKFISISGDEAIQTNMNLDKWDTLIAFTREIVDKKEK